MTPFAVANLAALVVLICGVAFSPRHVFKGYPAFLTILVVFVTGAVLAVNAL